MDAVGGHLNAYTSREHTAYYAKVLKEDVGLAVDVIADILQHSTVDPEELALAWRLRRVLHALDAAQAIELLIDKMKQTKSNAEFLKEIAKANPNGR